MFSEIEGCDLPQQRDIGIPQIDLDQLLCQPIKRVTRAPQHNRPSIKRVMGNHTDRIESAYGA